MKFVVPPPILLLSLAWRSKVEAACDYASDDCPYQADGECDADLGFCLEGTDCYDCDPCKQYRADCVGCVEAGCLWCPGDATCLSGPADQDFWDSLGKVTHCPDSKDWVKTCDPAGQDNFFNDPLYDSMTWSYDMIKVAQVWAMGYTGAGVHVRVNDNGVDASHPEFAGRFDVQRSCPNYLPKNYTADTHGTACASIIGAAGSNDECAVGIAPGVNLSSCVIYSGAASEVTPDDILQSFNKSWKFIDISSNSWGNLPCKPKNQEETRRLAECPFDPDHPYNPCNTCDTLFDDPSTCIDAITTYCTLNFENDPIACTDYLDIYVSCDYISGTLSRVQAKFFANAVRKGRNGRGTIFVFAAGNGYYYGEDMSALGQASSRFTISVGAVGQDGLHASYSTPGEALFISAPGGDYENVANNIVAKAGGGCFDVTVGTSFAAPTVTGVIALMLEANPQLGWRDVQAILAKTAQTTDAEGGAWSQTNRYGFSHSSKYGFGIVDAHAAVNMSLGWTNIGPEKTLTFDSGVIDIPIYNDDSKSSFWTLTVDGYGPEFVVEYVSVLLDIRHFSRGDLTIRLESPTGTESILVPGDRPEFNVLATYTTVKHYGEAIGGNWTVRIVDEEEDNFLVGCLDDPYLYEIFDPETSESLGFADCTTYVAAGICADGTVLTSDPCVDDLASNADVTAREACCACGGGIRVDEANPEMLRQVRVYFYGRYDEGGDDGTTTVSSSGLRAAAYGALP